MNKNNWKTPFGEAKASFNSKLKHFEVYVPSGRHKEKLQLNIKYHAQVQKFFSNISTETI